VAIADPISVDIGAGAVSLPRIGFGQTSGIFQSADTKLKVTFSHATGKRIRSVARLDVNKIAPDPLFPAQNTPYSMAMYVVVDVPLVGFSQADQQGVYTGLTGMLNATSYATLIKFLALQT
jgi:hypothetical protein